MNLEQIIQSPEALAFVQSVGSELLASYLTSSFLKREPEFKELVVQAKSDAIEELKKAFPEADVFSDDQFEGALETISNKISSNQTHELCGLSEIMADHLFENSLIYHPNEDTRSIYSTIFSEAFCVRLYTKLASSKRFASILTAKEAFSASQFRSTATKHLDQIQSHSAEIPKLSKQLNDLTDLIKSSSTTEPSTALLSSQFEDRPLTAEEDREIEKLFLEIRDLTKKDGTHHQQITLSKQLILRIPPSNTALYTEGVNTLLGSYLRGNQDEWHQGLKAAVGHSTYLNAYSRTIIAGLHNNLRQWSEGMSVIGSISKTDVLTFSSNERDLYYHVYALLRYNTGEIKEAKRLLDKCIDKNHSEYLNINFMLSAKDKDVSLLPKATEVLSDPKANNRTIQYAVNYLISSFATLQEEYGNAIDALTQLKPHLELAFVRSKELIEQDRQFTSEVTKDLIVSLPVMARLLGRSKEILEQINTGLERNYSDYIFLHNAAGCLLEQNLYQSALECYESINIQDIVINEGIDLYVFLLRCTGQQDKLPKILADIRNLPFAEIKKWPSILSVAAEIGGEEFQTAAKEAELLFPDESWSLLARAESYIQIKSYDDAIKLLKAATTQKQSKLFASVRLAKLYAFTLKQISDAVPYYEAVLGPNTPINEKTEYVSCLFDLKRFRDVIRRVDEFDSSATNSPLQKLKGYACSQLGLLDDARTILARVCEQQIDNYEVNFNYAVICRNLGLIDELTSALKNVVHIKPDDYRSHLMLSQGLFDQGHFKDAVTHARFALLGDFSNEITHVNFINIHRIASQACPDDKFIHSADLENLHRDILNGFSQRFPDSKLMTPIQIPIGDNGKPDFGFLKKMIEEQNIRRSNLLSYYEENALPIGFLKLGLGFNLYQLWSGLIGNDQDIGLSANRLSTEHIKRDIEKISISQEILVDGLALLTFQSSGLLYKLKQIGKKIVVSSATAKDFLLIRHSLQSSQDGYLNVTVQDGKMVRESISEVQVKNAKDFIEAICSFLKENTTTITTENGFQVPEKDRDIYNVLDPEYQELWNLECQLNRASVWTDGNLCAHAKVLGKTPCSIQALAVYFQQNKILTRDQYAILIGDMVLAKYRGLVFTPFDSAIYLRQNLNVRGEIYFDRLCRGPYFDDIQGRIVFLAELVVLLLKDHSQLDWLAQALGNHLFNQSIEDQSKLLFGVCLYTVALRREISSGLVDELVMRLSIKTQDGETMPPELFKAFVENAYAKIKQKELNSVKQKLGLPEESTTSPTITE